MRVAPRDSSGLSSLLVERPFFFSRGFAAVRRHTQNRILSAELSSHVGREVFLQGWVHRIRDFGGVRFIVLRDRSGHAQIVLPPGIDIGGIGCEWVIAVTGMCQSEPRAPGGIEVHASRIDPISPAAPPPLEVFNPQAASKNRLETLLDHRAVSLRIPEVKEVFRIQAEILRAYRDHLTAQGFTEIVTPKIVLAGAEGGAAMFKVEYYDRAAWLAQSPQFYKQIMVGSGLERVFETGHAYRAEKSETSRHTTEFLSLDLEMGFIESEQDVMRMVTGVMAAMFGAVKSRFGETLRRRWINLPEFTEIPQISFPEAKRILVEKFGKSTGLDGDLDTEAEKLICEWASKELGSELLYVTGYHIDRRPLYTMPDAQQPPLTRSFDLLFRGIEICTGGQRIHDHRQLVESILSRGLNPADYEGYLAAFKHGMPPHGGMGMGIERLLKQMLGLANIKEATAFPRDRYRLTP